MKITDEWLKEHGACQDAIEEISRHNNRDEIHLLKIGLKTKKYGWIRWYLRRRHTKKQSVMYAIFAAEAAYYAIQAADYVAARAADDSHDARAGGIKIMEYGIELLQPKN